MPEYNHGFNAPLKNALDFLHRSGSYKPVGFVSYGGISAGTRARRCSSRCSSSLKMTPLFEAVSIPFVAQFIDDEGDFEPNETIEQAVEPMLDELLRVREALAPLRGASG